VLADAAVERLDPATVRVRWVWADGADPGPVTVAAVDGPLAVAPPGVLQIELSVPATPRRLFLVRAGDGPELVVAERRLAVEGTLNFRDLGGYQGEEAKRVRWGRVFRSDNLAAVDQTGWSLIESLGIRAVYDLRHDAERVRAPTAIPAALSIDQRHLPIGGEAAEAPDLVELLRTDAGRFGLDFMVSLTRDLLFEHAEVFGRLVTELSDGTRLPAIFHCTAGKDRTGAAAALVLSALGVAREVVLDDYELTTHYRSRVRIEQLRPKLAEVGVDVEQVRPFLSAPRPALATALAAVDERFGSVERYLVEAAGVEPPALSELRANLLTWAR
jgi:protein-tyrosine phosphatase